MGIFVVIVLVRSWAIMKKASSKQKVIDAATLLFFQNGFEGTSVRAIAELASVNVSLISYYFKSKQGLLEHRVTDYYEGYLGSIESFLKQTETASCLEKLKELISVIMVYKQKHLQLSCSIHRELSLDSIFVREMTVTYLAKEHYLLSSIFFAALKSGKKVDEDPKFLFMQLKGMLMTPYLLHNEWKYHVVGNDSHKAFIDNYVQTIHKWLDFIIRLD